jgi:hypothetical protein
MANITASRSNPTPDFMFYQQYTGRRIGGALVDLSLGRG